MDWYTDSLLILLATILGMTVCSPTGKSLESNMLEKFESDWPIGDPRRCLEQMRESKFNVKRFEALPGIGWDNLRNVEADLVVTYNYSQCKMTDDGQLLIPNNVFTVPIKFSSVETFAELIDHWLNSSSTTSNTINVQAGLSLPRVSVSGTFSYENEQIKTKQIEDKAVTTRVQARYYRYEAKLQADPVLSSQFKNRLLSIAASIQRNHTEQARYEGQLLVRDFGTHILTSVTAGAGLLKDDYLKSDFVLSHTEQKRNILATASASFFDKFKMSASYGHKTDQAMTDMYEQSMTHSYIKSHGGPIFMAANMSINDWVKEVDNNLVVMDRAGDPLYFLVTPTLLPELLITTVADLQKIIRESIELYYEMNTIRGCTKLGSPNFSFSANFDDGSCHSKPNNLTFGGTYQQCSASNTYLYHDPCSGLNIVNPKTGTYSCPPSYTPIQLQSGRTAGQIESKKECHKCHLIRHCCSDVQFYSEAVFSTYWCAATGKVEKESGYLFGGLYTSITDNAVTGTKGCPPTFNTQQMFTDLKVCISDDYEMSEAYSVPFGGFFSCMSGNPLAGVHQGGSRQQKAPKSATSNYPSRCPDGYSQHLALDDLGCAIHYCVLTGSLSLPNLPPIKRPPFMPKPAVIMDQKDNIVMFDFDKLTWAKNENAQQLEATLNSSSRNVNQNSVNGMSAGTAAGISVCATLVCIAFATLIFVVIRRRQTKRQRPYKRLIDESFEPSTNYGSTGDESTAINVS